MALVSTILYWKVFEGTTKPKEHLYEYQTEEKEVVSRVTPPFNSLVNGIIPFFFLSLLSENYIVMNPVVGILIDHVYTFSIGWWRGSFHLITQFSPIFLNGTQPN